MKHKYLIRLILIMISLLFIPIMIVSTFFWRNSLNGLRTANDAYHEKILDAYVGILDDTIAGMQERAAFISAESRESESSLFEGSEGLEDDYYRLYQITQELIEINPYMSVSSDWGIYLYDINKSLKPGYASSLENIISSAEMQNLNSTEVERFFSIDNYKWSKINFCTTSNEENDSGKLMVGVCTYIGVYQDEALVYFEISSQDMEKAMTIIEGNNIGFHLYNEKSHMPVLSWGSDESAETGNVHRKETHIPELSIAAHLSEDTLQQNLYEYASNMGKLMAVLGVGLFVCCIGAVYISYKPIKQLTSELDYEEEGGEIDAIINVMKRDRSKIEAQESMILDLLISHLLYGGHISTDRIKHLGIDEDMKYYSVFLLCNHILNSDEVKTLATTAMHQFDSRLFVIEFAEENRNVFVLFSKKEEISELYTYLKQWLVQNGIETNTLYAGKVVDKMDDIQLSFRTCLAKEKRSQEAESKNISESTVSTKVEKQKKLVEDILEYLELNYTDGNLGQVQVADIFQISNYTLSRMFKSQVGIGFAEYLIDKRLAYAKQLLLSSDYSINEIATMSGFSSVHYFSRIFKSNLGITPSAFRKGKE